MSGPARGSASGSSADSWVPRRALGKGWTGGGRRSGGLGCWRAGGGSPSPGRPGSVKTLAAGAKMGLRARPPPAAGKIRSPLHLGRCEGDRGGGVPVSPSIAPASMGSVCPILASSASRVLRVHLAPFRRPGSRCPRRGAAAALLSTLGAEGNFLKVLSGVEVDFVPRHCVWEAAAAARGPVGDAAVVRGPPTRVCEEGTAAAPAGIPSAAPQAAYRVVSLAP